MIEETLRFEEKIEQLCLDKFEEKIEQRFVKHCAVFAVTIGVGSGLYFYFVRSRLHEQLKRIREDSKHIEQSLEALDVKLPPPKPPGGNYITLKTVDLDLPCIFSGLLTRRRQLLCFSGHVPWEKRTDGVAKTVSDGDYRYIGQIGGDVSIEQGQAAARLCIAQILSQLKTACAGDLGRVIQIIRLGVHVNSAPGFTDQPKVANGASDILVKAFGEGRGQHVRLAVGTNALPKGVCVEVEAMVEILRP